ncbi:hypothetical protein K1T71_008171 [Dendrolimus kikuchii]|uniref:Uncharacterized protein n=1 Tax=Dendrolimus kikuchii TaxID=765133 RepID=A0ACC1CWK6_9NEOP|nr:hypothetical protein K1T71_008171 [Dendrolimus kikuchii]
MAAEVPVSDVLCEAMEYLIKLGSNLRSRSENLKEKRIRKDKLKNSHAIQKAAHKVLLICDLSKKSLDNVEVGVRKILSHVKTNQVMDDGGKSSSSRSPDSRFQYFDFKNYKLRVSKRVHLEHFLSAKVVAEPMLKSTLDKYPVYYKCNLYRLRKTMQYKCKEKQNAPNNSEVAILLNKDTTEINTEKQIYCKNKKNDNTKLEIEANVEKAESESLEIEANVDKAESESLEVTTNMLEACAVIPVDENDEISDDINSKTKNKGTKVKEITTKLDSSKELISLNNKDENIDAIKVSSKVKETVLDNEDTQIKFGENITETSHSKQEIKDSKQKNKKHGESRRDSVKKKFRNIRIIGDSSDSDIDKSPEKVNSKEKEDTVKKETNSEKTHKQVDHTEEVQENNTDEVTKSREQPTKPLIKCVSMTKLLKPEVLNSVATNIHSKISPNKKSLLKPNRPDSENTSKLSENANKDKFQIHSKNTDHLHERQKLDDEEYWKEKRKEVEAFKPKSFVVKVGRLPEFSEKYLETHNIKRITQGSSLVFELQDNSENVTDFETLKKLKSDLLNDSDSNNEDPFPEKGVDKAKHALLDESDSDQENRLLNSKKCSKSEDSNKKNKDTEQNTEKCRDSEESNGDNQNSDHSISNNASTKKMVELEEKEPDEGTKENSHCITSATNSEDHPYLTSDQDKSVQSDNEKTDRTQIEKTSSKCSSQNSDSSSNRSTDKRKKSKKRKHAIESMRAKNMLLTYSSSSDTDGDQLNNVIKKKKSDKKKVGKKLDCKQRKISESSKSSSDQKRCTEDNERVNMESRSNSPAMEVKNSKRSSIERHSKESDNDSENAEVCSNASSSKMVRSKALPSSSSGHNSDSPDSNDKDIEGLTNLKSLNKVRRRRDSSTQDSEQTSSTTKREAMSKSPIDLGAAEVLAVDTSSDEASANEESGNEANNEELPMVQLSNLNGDGIGHIAKDDLLGESDSSVSQNEKDKTGSESDDENVKSKRRKQNTISSDSEVGSSRRKERHRMSDFEDSDDDNSEPVKRPKRKKKGSDSDASASAASSTEEGKKKRRRIKELDSDISGSDTENEGRNKHGRKNIRKVMGKNQLEEATKKAAREEKERIARITERQKLYNNMEFDESGKPDEVVLEKVVLDFDPETKEPLIEVDRGLVKKLKPHQANGIKFMWDASFESVKRIKKDKGSGCILAHCMGLGKTLQVVSLTHTLLTHGDLTSVNRVLVVCPLSTVLNWVNEFKMWLKHAVTDYEVDVYELSRYKQNSERAFQLQQWMQGGGVCVLGYEMFRNLSADNPKKFKKKMLKSFQEALVDPGPDLVVCDEGHLLKNEKTSLSQSMNRVKTRRRIVLTGTPLQNNLKEYYCMVQFVKPNLLGKYNEYLNRFVNPITNGQYTDSTEHDIRVMKRRSHVLHKMLDGAVQRRDYGVLAPFLPPKHEYVLFITLTEVQIKLYQFYLDNYSRRPQPGKSSGFLFPDFQSLQRIWTHPLVLKYNSERYEIMQQKKREREEEDSEGSLVDFIDDDSTPEESTTEESTDDSSEMSDDSRKKSKKKKAAKKGKSGAKGNTRRGTRANPSNLRIAPLQHCADEHLVTVVFVRQENTAANQLRDVLHVGDHKLAYLRLVFSQSLYSLDLIEHFLGKVDEATQEGRIDEKLASHVGSWSPGVDYFRLDGSTSCENRSIWCKNFNREDNPRARLFLISTRAGGLGINLVAANRVVIFDVSWNPSHDVQSIFRVYRFGQKKPCYVYRFLAMGTMEEKIYERQVTKQAISKRVIDEQQIDRHYAENDLAELYKFEPHPPTPRPLPPLPKDRLFAEMLREHEAQIYKYHEHDSLLENKEEETLTEEERKAAWEDFENEKNKPPPAPFPTAWPMHNGMFPGLMQQQQLAYAALAAMLRKDMPNINENQIRDMLPLLYNSNPGLVQKMNEIYKYTQSGMMNPMMNPMNAAAGGGAMGGSSGLHYEPPWQRQQQQQQHMRLQQLLQHQNMGAKYYAGGLGSRDPVAMAMQQQRAREIMMDPQARRPRGRPPMQPRMPAAPNAPGDVVNLDSD